MGRLPQTNTTVSRYLRRQKRVVTRMANATPYALSGTSVVGPGLTTVDERLVAGTPGGSRVELDSAGLRKYAADGTTVQVDLTGDVAAFSGLITGSEIIAGTAGAARLELDAAGLRQYAADGTTVLLNTADDATIRARGDNMALGAGAQKALTTGTGDTAVGSMAQQSLTTGDRNTAVGRWAQLILTTGGYNTAVGDFVQVRLTDGYWDTAVGKDAQQYLTTGSYNTAVGFSAQATPRNIAANATTTASYQTSIGPNTGQSSPTQVDGITTIGYKATAGAVNATSIGREARADHAGSIALGYQALTTQPDQVMVGPRDVEITDTTKGLVLVSPDATRMRITVANDGGFLVNGIAIAGGGASTGVDYSAGWADYGGAFSPATWYKDKDGFIRLSGLLKRTGATITNAASGTIFTLPVGARPAGNETFVMNKDSTGVVFCSVGSNGIVQVAQVNTWASGSAFMYLGGCQFKAA